MKIKKLKMFENPMNIGFAPLEAWNCLDEKSSKSHFFNIQFKPSFRSIKGNGWIWKLAIFWFMSCL